MAPRARTNPEQPEVVCPGGIELRAFSVSGFATYVHVPAFDICFDLGHCSAAVAGVDRIFLSHVHQDHAGGLPRYAALRGLWGASPGKVVCPHESVDALREVLEAWARLEEKPAPKTTLLRGVRPGDRVELGRRVSVDVFDVPHRIHSRGYSVVEHRKALLPEWEGRTGVEIGQAVAAGHTVHAHSDHRRLTYVGDHTIEVIAQNPEMMDCDVLLLEATYLPGTERDLARKWGHTHLEELVELYERSPELLPARHIVLKHFSMRHDPAEIRATHAILPDGLRQRVLLLAGEPVTR